MHRRLKQDLDRLLKRRPALPLPLQHVATPTSSRAIMGTQTPIRQQSCSTSLPCFHSVPSSTLNNYLTGPVLKRRLDTDANLATVHILLKAAIVLSIDAVARNGHQMAAGRHDIDQQRHMPKKQSRNAH
jgi:hypothetical protein